MYISSYLTLNTALSGVEAAQEELDTTGQNIDNADTDGYEEQTVNLVEADSLDIAGSGADGAMQLGTGVDATGISNAGDPYLDAAWRTQNAATNSASTTQGYLDQIQSALNEPSTEGISSQLSQFWNDWNTLAENATTSSAGAAEQAVVDDAQTLSTSFNSLSSEINGADPANPLDASNSSSVLGQVNTQYEDIMAGPSGSGASGGTVYNDAYNIASLNYQIVQAQAAGQTANDLIDQRSAALDDLSTLGNVTVQNNTDGSVTVYFAGVGAAGGDTSDALVQDPSGIAPGGAIPPGDNFGSYATTAGGTGTGWVQAFQDQYATAATTAAASTGEAATAAPLASTVGGTLGSLIGLAGYSATGFGDLGQPVDDGTGTPDYPTSADAGAAATVQGTVGQLNSQLNTIATDLMNEVNNPAIDYDGTATLTAGGTPTSTGPSPNATTQTGSGSTATGSPAITLQTTIFQMNTSTSTSNAAALLSVNPNLIAAADSGITAGQFTYDSTTGVTTVGDLTGSNLQTSTLGTSYEGNYSTDNDVALDEANNSGGAADLAYDSFVQQVGSLAQGADNDDTTQSALQTQITNQRQSVEGVDTDNEMANLIAEQQSYQASAKVMNAFSTVMDSLMTVVGE